MTKSKQNHDQKHRYIVESNGAKGFLAPLTFAVAEAALGFTFRANPKYLTAGNIILNSLWLRGSKELQENGKEWNGACWQAYGALEQLKYEYNDDENTITVEKEGKKYTCKLGEIDRDIMEEAIGLIRPYAGNPRPLTAGRKVLNNSWVSGDEAIKTDDELLIPVCMAAMRLVQFKEGSIKNV